MARVSYERFERSDDPQLQAIMDMVFELEQGVPNHFYVEMLDTELFKAKLAVSRRLWFEGELSPVEVFHVGVAVARANECPYCTGAFCTILNYGLHVSEAHVREFLARGVEAVDDERLAAIVAFAVVINGDSRSATDEDIARLRALGFSDRGIIQLIHLVSDFAGYNRLNNVLKTEYDYRDIWRQIGFGWDPSSGEPPGENEKGIRRDAAS